MGELQFQLLGPFQVWRDDARLDGSLTAQRARELLAFLVLERDQFLPAERLMDVFWPDLTPAAAANNLQGLVLRLRRWLEPGLKRGRDSRYLVTEGEGYRFLADGCRVDLDEFAHAAQAGQAALRADDLPAATAALQRARDLYRGELVADMPYAEWAFPARERLRETHLEALEGGQGGPRRARRGTGDLRRLPAPAGGGAGRRALRGDARAARGDPHRRRRGGSAGGSAHVGRAAPRGPGRLCPGR